MERAVSDGEIAGGGLTRDTTDDVDAEAETLRVNVLGESGEAGVLPGEEGGGKAGGNGDVAAVGVELEGEFLGRWPVLRVAQEPALVDDGEIAAEGLKTAMENIDVLAKLSLCTVKPKESQLFQPHGWTRCEGDRGGWRG